MPEYVVEYDNESDGIFVELNKEDIPLFDIKPHKIVFGYRAYYKFKETVSLDEIVDELDLNSDWSFKSVERVSP